MKKLSLIAILLLTVTYNLFARANATVNEDRVRIRTAPSLKYSKVVTVVTRGQPLIVHSKTSEKETIDGFTCEWYEVEYDDRSYGWIYGAYIDIEKNDDNYFHEYTKAEAITQALYEELYHHFFNGEAYNAKIEWINGNYKLIDQHSFEMKCSDGTTGTATTYTYDVDGNEVIMGFGGWLSTTIKKNIPNSFSVKIGMTKDQLREMLGPEIKEYYWVYLYGDEACIKFNFSGNTLESIYIDRNAFTGD